MGFFYNEYKYEDEPKEITPESLLITSHKVHNHIVNDILKRKSTRLRGTLLTDTTFNNKEGDYIHNMKYNSYIYYTSICREGGFMDKQSEEFQIFEFCFHNIGILKQKDRFNGRYKEYDSPKHFIRISKSYEFMNHTYSIRFVRFLNEYKNGEQKSYFDNYFIDPQGEDLPLTRRPDIENNPTLVDINGNPYKGIPLIKVEKEKYGKILEGLNYFLER